METKKQYEEPSIVTIEVKSESFMAGSPHSTTEPGQGSEDGNRVSYPANTRSSVFLMTQSSSAELGNSESQNY